MTCLYPANYHVCVLGIRWVQQTPFLWDNQLPRLERHATAYPGVYYIISSTKVGGRAERIYYIMYRRNGKLHEEKAGRQFQDDMTPARAAQIRVARVTGTSLPNKERRQREKERSYTMTDIWQEYKEARQHIKRLRDFEGYFTRHIEPDIGNKTPSELTPSDIDRLKTKYRKAGCAPQSIKHYLALISRLVRFGANRGLCEDLPFRIEYPKFDNRVTEDLTEDQIIKLMEESEKYGNKNVDAIIKLALYTGMRKEEMLRLTWGDIDFERGFITIRGAKGVVTETIPLNRHARETIESIHAMEQHLSIKEDRPARTEITDFLFPGRNGKQRGVTAFARQLREIYKNAGIPPSFRPLHGLRHVFASRLASSGKVDMYTLQKLLTHKSPQMTQRYAHLRDEALKRAADVMDEIFD